MHRSPTFEYRIEDYCTYLHSSEMRIREGALMAGCQKPSNLSITLSQSILSSMYTIPYLFVFLTLQSNVHTVLLIFFSSLNIRIDLLQNQEQIVEEKTAERNLLIERSVMLGVLSEAFGPKYVHTYFELFKLDF